MLTPAARRDFATISPEYGHDILLRYHYDHSSLSLSSSSPPDRNGKEAKSLRRVASMPHPLPPLEAGILLQNALRLLQRVPAI